MNYKYLLIAVEPWEIRFAIELARNIREDQEVKLLIADHYTSFYQKEFLQNLEVPKSIQIITMDKQFKSWQASKHPGTRMDSEIYDLWENKICKQRSLTQILNSHQGLNGYENQATYLAMSESWKKTIYFDYLKFATDLFLVHGKYRVITISRRSLLSNLIWEYSQYLNFEFLTITQSRIGNRLIVRDDFGYGMRAQHLEKIELMNSSQTVTNFINELKSRNFLYKSWTNLKIEELITQAKHPIQSFFCELKKALRRSLVRLVYEYPIRRGKIRRLGESLVRLSVFEITRSFRKLILRLFHGRFFETAPPDVEFFAWFLHARPEDSTLVLGNGEDEVEKMIAFAKELNSDQCLVVKENAQMFGARPIRFYLNLKRRGLLLLDPTHNNEEIFSKMAGIVGISGTVLLESKLMGFNSYALGAPEFIHALDNRIYPTLREFLEKAPTIKHSNEVAIKYVAWILSHAPKDHLAFESDWNSPDGKETLQSVSSQISQYWTDYKVSE